MYSQYCSHKQKYSITLNPISQSSLQIEISFPSISKDIHPSVSLNQNAEWIVQSLEYFFSLKRIRNGDVQKLGSAWDHDARPGSLVLRWRVVLGFGMLDQGLARTGIS